MNEERFWFLVSLRFSGEASLVETEELNQILLQNPELNTRLALLQNVWAVNHPGLITAKDNAYNKHLQRLSNHFSEPVLQYDSPDLLETVTEQTEKPVTKYRWLWWSAAAVASVAMIWFSVVRPANNTAMDDAVAKNTISTKRGSKSKIQLPDGTQVWLNADSKIEYNENFQGKLREVQLTGEAFFDVVRDASRPFIIHTSTIDVKVLGTSFNVRSYANEKNTETSLIRGSVEITLLDNPDKKIILKPNEKLVVQNKRVPGGTDELPAEKKLMLTFGKVNYKLKDSSIVETLWVKNKLAFDEETLEDIALKIERWFDVKVTITDDRLKSNRYTAFFEDENLPQVMEALRISASDFNYSIDKKDVTIRP